ncbi:MAG: hypothetical protein CVU57_22910 [Deltaproteobacteria bacterium HGW-Deltaproteobacteria-15]|jgi:hypothetical protein|nr:MAG: hypothetical protein CVU57_22910 [Deltaproteobacteria bacterium HGW-Deltaproteobacteria-15]
MIKGIGHVGVVALLLLAGCTGFGPLTVSRDRFDYTSAISDSWKRQMLFNMVKIRYGDAPVFMDVSSVISQYQVAGQINLGATINNHPWSSSQTLGAFGQYVDRPTITFTPILGDKFARSMMSPIPPSAILSLIQGGHRVDVVFRVLVHEINGIRNRFGGEARARSADPEFYPLLEKMRRIQSSGDIGMRIQKIDKQEAALMVFRGKRDSATGALAMEVRKMLGLDPLANDFHVVYGTVPKDDKEIALLTRSILEVLVDLSADIEVPADDVQEKRVAPTFAEKAADEEIRPLMRIQSSSAKPGDAFVSVPYRNSYFWIDDRDLMSKKLFSFLMFIFTLVETGEKGPAPIVTIPTG